jgi:hypothetical protein
MYAQTGPHRPSPGRALAHSGPPGRASSKRACRGLHPPRSGCRSPPDPPDTHGRRSSPSRLRQCVHLPSSRLRAPGFSHGGESRAVRRRRMAYAAWHSWPSGGILPVCTRAMNPCLVGVGPMHPPNRMFAAFRWANRQRVKHARSTWIPPSIWELRPPVVLVDTQQVARHQVVQPRSPLSSDMGSVTAASSVPAKLSMFISPRSEACRGFSRKSHRIAGSCLLCEKSRSGHLAPHQLNRVCGFRGEAVPREKHDRIVDGGAPLERW